MAPAAGHNVDGIALLNPKTNPAETVPKTFVFETLNRGHKTIEMTLRYAHLSPAHELEAVQKLVKPKSEPQLTPLLTPEARAENEAL